MYTLGAGKILIKSIIIVCLLNLMAWKASWAHRTGENEKKKDNDNIKKSVQTSSACDLSSSGVVTDERGTTTRRRNHQTSIVMSKVERIF